MKTFVLAFIAVAGVCVSAHGQWNSAGKWLAEREALAEKQAAQQKVSSETVVYPREFTLSFDDGRRWRVLEYRDHIVFRTAEGTFKADITR